MFLAPLIVLVSAVEGARLWSALTAHRRVKEQGSSRRDTVLVTNRSPYVVIRRPRSPEAAALACQQNGLVPLTLEDDADTYEAAIRALVETGADAAWIGGYWRCDSLDCAQLVMALRSTGQGAWVEGYLRDEPAYTAARLPVLCRPPRKLKLQSV